MADTLRNEVGLGLPSGTRPYMSTYRDVITNKIWRQESFPGGSSWIDTTSNVSVGDSLWEVGTGSDSAQLIASGGDASGVNAIAEGFNTAASGDYSHAEGYQNIASGKGSHAEGGYDTKDVRITIASGINSHTEGKGTLASGSESHAEGRSTTASGLGSHAEGENTLASGSNAHAEGIGTVASGSASHAQGNGCIASTNHSHAGGRLAVVMGNESFAHSSESTVNGNYSAILGGQNLTLDENDTVAVPDFQIKKTHAIPTSSLDTIGGIGSITWDGGFIYVKTNNFPEGAEEPGQWLRASLVAF